MNSFLRMPFLMLLCLVLQAGINAQDLERVEFRLKDGTTKKGLISYKNELKNFSRLEFYKNRNAEPERLSLNEIDSMKIGGFHFLGARISVESSPERKKELSNTKEPIMREDNALLLPIVEGPKSLYYYKDEDEKEHYIIKIDGQFEALIHKKYADYYGSVIRLRENRMYIGQLAQYLKTPEWRVDFSSFTYELNPMRELFLYYYRVNEIEPSYVYKNEERKKRRKKKKK